MTVWRARKTLKISADHKIKRIGPVQCRTRSLKAVSADSFYHLAMLDGADSRPYSSTAVT